MGLILAALGSVGSVMTDQWKNYFYCEAIPANTLVVRGKKRSGGGSDNVISNGSVIAVADGQCMIIVEQGKIVDFCAVPGEYTYDASSQPSLLSGGNLADNILDVFAEIGKRFSFGGAAPVDQRVYYFNTKELIGNKYGTPSPVPFRVVDPRADIDIDITVRCFGEYSYRITNPILFYTNICGNITNTYTRDAIDGQLKSELLTALQPAFAKLSEMGIRYSALPGHTTELAEALNEVLSSKWRDLRGIEIVSLGVSSIKASEEDEKRIKDIQTYKDPMLAAAAAAMQDAAKNPGGASVGFMGMNMASSFGGSLFQQSTQQNAVPSHPADAPAGSWKCSCGAIATGKFCPECGAKKPEDGWKCSCGAVNKGKFCTECGAKKPSGALLYRCDKCGWEPEDPAHPPKFCPECGDPFDSGDIIGS